MATPLISIVRCNLLITYKGLNELAGRSWFDKYTMQCPALYTTSLISQIPATFYTNKRISYVFSEGNGLLAQNFIINFSYNYIILGYFCKNKIKFLNLTISCNI